MTGFWPSIIGLSWIAVEVISIYHLLTTNHAQPLPNLPAPEAWSFSLNASKPPKAELMASANVPFGAPPAFGPMIFQKKEWLECPPALFRTTVRIDSGT